MSRGFNVAARTELQAALAVYLTDLPPPGRRPKSPAGVAGGIITGLAALLAGTADETIGDVLDWLPSEASSAALDLLGQSRGLTRYAFEGDDTWRRRVIGASAFWRQAGTLPGLVLALSQLGYDAQVLEYYRTDVAHWSEFTLYLAPNSDAHPSHKWAETGAKWGGSTRLSWGVTLDDALRIRAIVAQVKPAHTKLRTVYLVLGNGPTDVWDNATGSWDDGTYWGRLVLVP